MEGFSNQFYDQSRKKEVLNISITPDSGRFLAKMLNRPNPHLAEFMFMGLGDGITIDKIIVTDENNYPSGSGLLFKDGFTVATTSDNEEDRLLRKIKKLKAVEKIMVVGHSHPTVLDPKDKRLALFPPSTQRLIPSIKVNMLNRVVKEMDLGYASHILNNMAWLPRPYFGIAAVTDVGPSLRLYRTFDLAKMKWPTAIYSIPQVTISL